MTADHTITRQTLTLSGQNAAYTFYVRNPDTVWYRATCSCGRFSFESTALSLVNSHVSAHLATPPADPGTN